MNHPRLFHPARAVYLRLAAVLLLLAATAPALRAQGLSLYYREVNRGTTIYVFNTPPGLKAYLQSGAQAPGVVSVKGYGPGGETVVFENQYALDLYNFKHDKIADEETDKMIAAQRSAASAAAGAGPATTASSEALAKAEVPMKVQWKPNGLTFTQPNFELRFGFRTQITAVYDHNEYCGDCFNVTGVQARRTLSTNVTAVTNLPFTTTPLGNGTTGGGYATTTIGIKNFKPFFSGWAFDKRFRWDIQYQYSSGAGNNNLGLREAYGEWEFHPAAVLRVGQWKGPYARQRMLSDGRNQFQDTSIATTAFGMSYETGLMFYGNFGGDKADRLEYNLGVFNGTGGNPANVAGNTDNRPLYAARFVWTPFGKYGFAEGEGAVDNPQTYKMYMGMSANTNKNRSGVGTLNITNTRSNRLGYEIGGKYKIFSYAGEYFVNKTDNDTANYASAYNPTTGAPAVLTALTHSDTDSRGWYAQVGVFAIPKVWDFAFRYSVVDPNDEVDHQSTREWRIGTNWYLSQSHYHKLQFDIGKIRREFNGKYVNTLLSIPALPPVGCLAGNFACDDREKDETQARLQYQFWF